jgi:hypothetical protein
MQQLLQGSERVPLPGESRSKIGEAGIQLLRILHLCDNENNVPALHGNRLNHKRSVLSLKANLHGGLLQHIAKKLPGFFGAVSQLAELNLPCGQIFTCQYESHLTIIDFLDFQRDPSSLQTFYNSLTMGDGRRQSNSRKI